MKYSFHPWHQYYLARAQQEVTKLKLLYPDSKIEHFGSTAIPGLGGKGIVDISISVPPESFESTFKLLEKSEWDYRQSGGVPNERIFFQKTVNYSNHRKQLFHLHLTRNENTNMIDCLAFRDYLISHPTIAQEYSECKRLAVKEAKKLHKKADKKKVYIETKRPVIEMIIIEMKNRL